MQKQTTYDIPKHDVLIISPGGVASSYFIDYLTYINIHYTILNKIL